MYSLLRPFVISSMSLFIIRLLVFNIITARIKSKIGLSSLLYYLNSFLLYITVLIDSLLFIKSKFKFLNFINNSTIPYF
jgi:hypothetical protein